MDTATFAVSTRGSGGLSGLALMANFAAALAARLRTAVDEQFDLSLDHVLVDTQRKPVNAQDNLSSCLAFYSVHSGRDTLEVSGLSEGAQGAA